MLLRTITSGGKDYCNPVNSAFLMTFKKTASCCIIILSGYKFHFSIAINNSIAK